LTEKYGKENLAILKKVCRMMNSRDKNEISNSVETISDQEIFDSKGDEASCTILFSYLI